jgi:putative transcription factor
LFCEICGSEIVGKPGRALVEGATMVVCSDCAGLGTALPGFPVRPRARSPMVPRIVPSRTAGDRLPRTIDESELLDDYPRIIKQAREKIGLSQQQLAFKAKETVTMIQKIELGKMQPPMRLAVELEHILRVKLVASKAEVEIPTPPIRQTGDDGPTLGDIAIVRHKENSQTKP